MIIDGTRISPEMVAYAIASSNYTVLHLTDGRTLVSSYWLSYVCAFLMLVRISRSCAVNLNHVQQITPDEVEMKTGETFSIPRRRREELKKFCQNLI